MHAKIFSATTIGVDAHLVQVEVDLSPGLVNFYIVGLPDTAIKESDKRVQTSLKNSGFHLPCKRITVNLAPADLKKEGTLFDLPIAVGILCAAGYLEIPKDFLQETLFMGELSLDGSIRFIKGALAIAYDAHTLGKKRVIVPKANAHEASLIKGLEVIGVESLPELVAFLRGECVIKPTECSLDSFIEHNTNDDLDFSQVKGQYQAKRALQVSAAGGHNILFIGSPGSGKTMLARRLPTIMPGLTFNEMLATSKVYSITGKLHNKPLICQRPFRDPHHTISQAGLVGGGSYPQPGEISLAHNGILFLDELTEFKRTTLEVMRQPLESKQVSISRVHQSVTFPAAFLLVAALNPCPCGYWGDKKKACICTPQQVNRYLEKLSGPLLDRIDLQVAVQGVDYTMALRKAQDELSSAQMRVGVDHALAAQMKRFGNNTDRNAHMRTDDIEQFCQLTAAAETIIKKAFEVLHLSMRGYHKILKVARTIADIEQQEVIDISHIQEAIMYRSLDQIVDKYRQMIIGVGIDAVAIERLVPWTAYDFKKLARIFSEKEIAYSFAVSAKSAERLAARFAAKEAFFKALSAAMPDHGLSLLTICRHVSVASSRAGAPYLIVDWRMLTGLASVSLRGQIRTHLAITHTQTMATVVVIIEK